MILAAVFLVGCGPSTREYQVLLKNDTPEALTIGLIKNGGPPERMWASPEELAIDDPQGTDRVWGVVVPPGKTARTPVVKGKFDEGVVAFLRVYSNGGLPRLEFSRLLAIGRGEPNRLDLRLQPGPNEFLIRDQGGVLNGFRAGHAAE